MNALEKTIVALDNMTLKEVHEFLTKCEGAISNVKIGMELFYAYGPSIVNEIHQKYNTKIFLDLKLHDIPNTVSRTIRALTDLPIELLTLHLSGGTDMIKRALGEQHRYLPNTKLLGVTYLTSLDENDFKLLWDLDKDKFKQGFSRLVNIALETEIQGIICSPKELAWVNQLENDKNKPGKLLKVCPGIRFEDEINTDQVHDQKRVLTPDKAVEQGASYLVIGRSLTLHHEPHQRLEILRNIS